MLKIIGEPPRESWGRAQHQAAASHLGLASGQKHRPRTRGLSGPQRRALHSPPPSPDKSLGPMKLSFSHPGSETDTSHLVRRVTEEDATCKTPGVREGLNRSCFSTRCAAEGVHAGCRGGVMFTREPYTGGLRAPTPCLGTGSLQRSPVLTRSHRSWVVPTGVPTKRCLREERHTSRPCEGGGRDWRGQLQAGGPGLLAAPRARRDQNPACSGAGLALPHWITDTSAAQVPDNLLPRTLDL